MLASEQSIYSRERPSNIVILACALLAVGLIDFAHMLSYKGMPEFITPSGPEKGLNFWLAARFLAALALLAVALRPWQPLANPRARYGLLAGSLAITALVGWAGLFYPQAWPRTFIDGQGLTPFKIGAEYAIIAILLVPAVRFYQQAKQQQPYDAASLFAATAITILSELSFTLYSDMTDTFNLLGHLYKIVAYTFIFRAVFVASVREPFQRLDTELAENLRISEELKKHQERLAELVAERTTELQQNNVKLQQEITSRQRAAAQLEGINRIFRESLLCETVEELGKSCLTVSEELSGSKFGFLGELNPEGLFDTLAISTLGWDICKVPVGHATLVIRNMPIQGVDRSTLREGKSRIVNGEEEIRNHPDHVVIPEGHPPLLAFMGIPLKQVDKTIGMIGLGNKEGGYTPADQEDVENLAIAIVEALNRNRAEAAVRKLNQEMAKNAAQLETANQDLEGFSHSVSHDLRAPLRAIDGFSLILLEDYSARLDNEGKRLLNVVRDNTVKMSRLIDDILLFSRAGRQELALVEVDMEALVRSVWEELAPTLGARNVQFEVKALPRACGDHSALAQAMTNLLANAAKFTRPRDPAVIEVGGSAGESESIYYVKDNGVGFDMQYAPKLFGVFQRLHGMDEFEGTGIGLAIVKRVITKHGGRVWAEGKVNEGASFFFALPRREPCLGGKP